MRIAFAFFGAGLMVAGIAARVVASRHAPGLSGGAVIPGVGQTSFGAGTPYGWPPTAYDAVRIGGWALLIFGAVIIAFALVREFRKAS